jgi:flavin reductase (DIM6/NTAB) family NADH-FMN oxidoreductase RutF
MKTYAPHDLGHQQFHSLVLGVVAPRPIAFVSTISASGDINLSPFSYFNVFSTHPPVLGFSVTRRFRDSSLKHTLIYARQTREVVVNIANYELAAQMSLASCEYPDGVNEFVKAGLTQVPSLKVAPPRVGEAPAAFECRVRDIIELGQEGGAGYLVLCDVLLMHIKETLIGSDGQIDPFALDAVSRMGANWYCRAQGESIFELPKPGRIPGIGFDQLPLSVRQSPWLTGRQLAFLAGEPQLPTPEEIAQFAHAQAAHLTAIGAGHEEALHKMAIRLIEEGKLQDALKAVLLAAKTP